jgi:AAA domain
VPRSRVVVLDEVQRVPALLNEVHRAIENERRRFVLLCSSARRLKTANTNLVAGRASAQPMYLFVPAELRKDFDLERVLRFGSIPLVWQAADARATLEAYVQFYIREEIRADAQDLKRRTWRGSIRCAWKPPRLNAKSYEYSEGFSTSSMERSRREKEKGWAARQSTVCPGGGRETQPRRLTDAEVIFGIAGC